MPLRLTPSVSILLPGKNPYQASEVDPYLLSGLSKNSRIRSIEQINKSNSSMSLLKKQDKKYLGRNGGETQEYGLE